MNIEALRHEATRLIATANDEDILVRIVGLLREPTTVAVEAGNTTTAPVDDDEALVSFDADGRGYTARQLGDTLDERVRAMRRGEGMLTLEEYLAKSRAWRSRTT